MTATHHAEPRPLESAQNPPRELQVLFHLMDVSRPKAETCAAVAVEEPKPEPETAEQASETACETPCETADLALLATLKAASEPQETVAEDPDRAYRLMPAPILEPLPSAFQQHEAIGEESTEQPEQPQAITVSEPNPPEETAVAVRQRTEPRPRRRPEPIQEEWLSSHGKIIAIGFTLALICTIYYARTNRRQIAVPDAASQRQSDAGARIRQTADADKDTPDIVLEMQSPAGQVVSSPAADISNSAPGNTPAIPNTAMEVTKADLHSPTIPQLPARGSEISAPAGTGDNLFVWENREGQRVAARPELPSAPPANAAAPGPAPSLPPSPPTEPSSYPVTNYSSPYQPQPVIQSPQQAGPGASAPSGAPSNSQENSTRGYRYERSGSGLY